MSAVEATILDLKREFVAEAMALATVYATWAARYLDQGADDMALTSFARLVDTVREAAIEMAAIRAALPTHDETTGEAAAQHRAQRGPRRVA